jgi:hypothetical protein
MRRRLRRFAPFIALVLIHLMTPGSVELTENLIHFVASGHGAHSLPDDAHQPDDDEHGCSGPYHFCDCHHSSGFLNVSFFAIGAALGNSQQLAWSAADAPLDPFLAGLDRPPRA